MISNFFYLSQYVEKKLNKFLISNFLQSFFEIKLFNLIRNTSDKSNTCIALQLTVGWNNSQSSFNLHHFFKKISTKLHRTVIFGPLNTNCITKRYTCFCLPVLGICHSWCTRARDGPGGGEFWCTATERWWWPSESGCEHQECGPTESPT